MFNRLRHTIDILAGRHSTIEDKLAEAARENAWLRICVKGWLMQKVEDAGRIRYATQLRMLSKEQIWIARDPESNDLVVALRPEHAKPHNHLEAVIRSR